LIFNINGGPTCVIAKNVNAKNHVNASVAIVKKIGENRC